MNAGAKTAATLGGLLVLVLIATLWGFNALTAPFPKSEDPPLCIDTSVAAGDRVFRTQVVVSVFNGSQRSGLAKSTQDLLVERGFVAGDTGNAPEPSATTYIQATDPDNAAVQLVKRQFRGAKVVAPTGTALGNGVVVVVGEGFASLKEKDIESVRAKTDSTFCMVGG